MSAPPPPVGPLPLNAEKVTLSRQERGVQRHNLFDELRSFKLSKMTKMKKAEALKDDKPKKESCGSQILNFDLKSLNKVGNKRTSKLSDVELPSPTSSKLSKEQVSSNDSKPPFSQQKSIEIQIRGFNLKGLNKVENKQNSMAKAVPAPPRSTGQALQQQLERRLNERSASKQRQKRASISLEKCG